MSFRRVAASLLPRIVRSASADVQPASRAAVALAANWAGQPAFSPAASAALIRNFSSTAASFNSLSGVLRNELEYERQNYSQPEELATGPPQPFTLTETRGDTLLSLTRTHGGETISVDVMVNDQPEEEPFESEDGVMDVDVGVLFSVQVARGDESLVFDCKSDGSYLTILHVSLEPSDGEFEDSMYTGPVYDELDEEVQRQFIAFLESRGVTPDLGGYLLRAVHDKEQREYIYWLERVHAFVEQP